MQAFASSFLPKFTASPARRARARFQQWVHSRQPRTDTLLLTQRNVYILPTRAGLMFGLTLIVLLLASINYQLNLGYVLTFLLAGSGVVSMHLTHATLRGLTLHLKPIAPAFAGAAVGLDVVLTTPGKARFGIGLKVGDAPAASISWLDVPALAQAHAQLTFIAAVRGRAHSPTLGIETRFPLGLFRCWSVWRPSGELLVYPMVEPSTPPLPAARSATAGALHSRSHSGGEIEGVRGYRRGDPAQLIAWKKAAKAIEAGGELVSRDTSASAARALLLDWQACGGLAPEERLSRLTAWTLMADRLGAEYGMRLPGIEIAPAAGDAQRRRCLEALALWQ